MLAALTAASWLVTAAIFVLWRIAIRRQRARRAWQLDHRGVQVVLGPYVTNQAIDQAIDRLRQLRDGGATAVDTAGHRMAA